MRYRELPDRFRTKVQIAQDGCWLWTAGTNGVGYGKIHWGAGHRKLAHRVAYELAKGTIPAGFDIDHLCRVRSCVNPRHLEVVTRRENLLRGDTIPARNARKTHCPQGHSYSGSINGARICHVCRSAAVQRCKKKRLGSDPEYRERERQYQRDYYQRRKLLRS